MYPQLGGNDLSQQSQIKFKKTLPPSEEITNAILDLKQTLPSISSFKPHLNTHQCHLSLILNGKLSIPIKVVFLRNYPREKPLIFVTQWIVHPIVNPYSCQIQYEHEWPWKQGAKLSELLKRIQGRMSQPLPTFQSQLDTAVQQLQHYSKQLESLRTKPPGTQPPPPPQLNLEQILKTFEHQENLYSQCEQKNSLYMLTAQEYNQNVSRVKAMSEKFGKGKILREMEKKIESEIEKMEGTKISDVIHEYYQKRKNLHKMKILKELYLESS